jgi:hypothetical protein
MDRISILAVVTFAISGSEAYGDLRNLSSAGTCFIEITNGPTIDSLSRWRAGTLTRAEACLRIGTEIDRTIPTFPERPISICVGPNYGADATRAVVLCRERGSMPGPSDSKTFVWGDQLCSTSVGRWDWFDGSTVWFLGGSGAEHSAAPGMPGKWSQAGATVTITWPKWTSVDTPTLSADGLSLTGLYGKNPTSPGAIQTSRRVGCI